MWGLDAAPTGRRWQYRRIVLVQLGVTDLDKSIQFYTGTLGFQVTERRNDLQFAHLSTNVDGLQIGLSAGGTVAGSGSVVLNIGVADTAAARAALEATGVIFPRPTAVIPGKVALAEFKDPDGNRLRFAGPPRRRSSPNRLRQGYGESRRSASREGGRAGLRRRRGLLQFVDLFAKPRRESGNLRVARA